MEPFTHSLWVWADFSTRRNWGNELEYQLVHNLISNIFSSIKQGPLVTLFSPHYPTKQIKRWKDYSKSQILMWNTYANKKVDRDTEPQRPQKKRRKRGKCSQNRYPDRGRGRERERRIREPLKRADLWTSFAARKGNRTAKTFWTLCTRCESLRKNS